jgi:hypothetical protein
MALAHAQLGQWEKAKETILTALNLRTEVKLSHIDRGLESILVSGPLRLFHIIMSTQNHTVLDWIVLFYTVHFSNYSG